MSASSMFFSGGSRRTWRDVSHARRCPVCGSGSWCQVGTGDAEGVTLCKRVASERRKVNDEGVEFWVHGGQSGRGGHSANANAAVASPRPCRPNNVSLDRLHRAPLRQRTQVYDRLLDMLELTEAHRRGLEARGLSAAHIRHGRYRSLPVDWRARQEIAHALVDSFGVIAAGVPGVVPAKDRDGQPVAGRWTIAGLAGLLIPVRIDGNISALKIRRDDDTNRRFADAPRYSALSSTSAGGVSAEVTSHRPAWARCKSAPLLRITEGELKADVATALSGVPTISVPGIGQYKLAFEVVHVAQPEMIEVVFDHDENPETRARADRYAKLLVRALCEAGYAATQRVIDGSEGKGIDDVLLHRVRAGDVAA